ncbi:MAG: lipopeptide [Gammaproteobacteria bacterium]|nr:lipoprotein [Beggiatoa alba]PCH61250.1 MAG: lipopeptide [Gammaproteobacteria bacterium]
MKSLLIFALLALASLSACGQKGDLILPDDSPTHDKSELG